MESLEELFGRKYGDPIRASGATWMMYKCPECGHGALACNLENGYIMCHFCGVRGRARGKSSSVEGKKVDARAQINILRWVFTHGEVAPAYKRFLNERGIVQPEKYWLVTCPWNVLHQLRKMGLFTDQQLLDSGLFQVGKRSGELIPTLFMSPNRLLVPYFSQGKLVGAKSRVALSDELEQGSIRYLNAPGFPASKYLWNVTREGQDLYITEGELKAITGLSFGQHCVSIPGLQSWSSLLPSLRKLAARYRRAFIVLDSDPGYQRSIPHLTTATALCSALPNSCILFLPQPNSWTKGALDTFLVTSSEADFLGLSEDAWINRHEVHRRWTAQLTKLRAESNSNSVLVTDTR